MAESELLPSAPDCANILFDDAVALIRCGGQAANVERTGLGLALSALNVGAVRCLNGALTEAERGRFAGHVEEAETAAEAATENGFNLSVIDYLAERWALRDDAINLLQDAYKPAPAVPSETGKWRRSAVLTVLWLLLGMAGLAAKGWWSSSRADALEAQSLTLYRSIFPGDRSVTAQSLRRRLRSRLGAPTQSADASLVSLVGHLAAVLKPSMRVASIDYNRSRGEFNVDLLLKNYEDVEVLREALAAKAETEITSAEQVDEACAPASGCGASRCGKGWRTPGGLRLPQAGGAARPPTSNSFTAAWRRWRWWSFYGLGFGVRWRTGKLRRPCVCNGRRCCWRGFRPTKPKPAPRPAPPPRTLRLTPRPSYPPSPKRRPPLGFA